MKLTYFKIENYRSVARAEIDHLSNVTILIGPNNEGKSNVLQALHTCLNLLRDGMNVPRASGERVRLRYSLGSYDWESDYPVARQEKFPEGNSIFELHFSLADDEKKTFFETTGSRLNGVLPIQLQFGTNRYATFKVLKQGIGGAALSKKVAEISKFFSLALDYAYIPAIRTADTSIDIIKTLIRGELRALEKNPKYTEIQMKLLGFKGRLFSRSKRS